MKVDRREYKKYEVHALSIRIQHQVSTINQNAHEIIFERREKKNDLNDPKTNKK